MKYIGFVKLQSESAAMNLLPLAVNDQAHQNDPVRDCLCAASALSTHPVHFQSWWTDDAPTRLGGKMPSDLVYQVCHLDHSRIEQILHAISIFVTSRPNVTPVTEVRSASFGLVLHAQHLLQILVIFSTSEGYQIQFSIPHAYFVYTV